jgi:cbb3-type cytochrome oxidase maturation protein
MEALYLLIPLSVVAIFVAAWLFLRMSDSGQFDDMDGPAWSVLHDDDRPQPAARPPAAQGLDAAQHQPEPPDRK